MLLPSYPASCCPLVVSSGAWSLKIQSQPEPRIFTKGQKPTKEEFVAALFKEHPDWLVDLLYVTVELHWADNTPPSKEIVNE